MIRLRPKLESTESSKEWMCCACIHVRTGTIMLGMWHLMLHVLVLAFLAAMVHNPELLEEVQSQAIETGSLESNPFGTYPRDQSFIYQDADVGALVTVCSMALTLMLIYGASRGKPAHLLPFFCLQIFDLAITLLTVMGYICYLHSIHRLVEEAKQVPWREQLLALPSSVLVMIVLAVFIAAIYLKTYFVGVVWRCYKYLTMRNNERLNLAPLVYSTCRPGLLPIPAPTSGVGAMHTSSYSSRLPDYADAVKQTPPPSYRAATLLTSDPANAANPTKDQMEQNQSPAACTVVMLPPQGEQVRV